MRDPNYARFTGRYGAEDGTELARNVLRHKQGDQMGDRRAQVVREDRDYVAHGASVGRVPRDPRERDSRPPKHSNQRTAVTISLIMSNISRSHKQRK